jgi:ketosteroid isomerase-like protein
MADETGFADARARVATALGAIGSGDPLPYIDCWAERDDVTLLGAWGPIEQGHAAVTGTFRWVGGRFEGGGGLAPDDRVVCVGADMAYTVGFERGEVVVDGGALQSMTLRVTHIYRRSGDGRKLVQRHADFPPADQRVGGGG